MWLVKVISPTNVPSRKTEWNRYVRFYVWLLCRLKWLYARGAISDTINVGPVIVTHNVRDYWFEQELHRFGIDMARHLNSHTLPIIIKRRYRLPDIFSWTESIQIQCEGKKYTINRAKRLTFETDMDGAMKISTPKDLFFRSEFTAKNDSTKERPQENDNSQLSHPQTKPDPPPSTKRNKPKITVKDTIPSPNTEQKKEIHTTKHQGFEENDAF